MNEERIGGTAETMLQSLYARAKESEKAHHKIYDPKAVEIVSKIKHDFTQEDKDAVMSASVVARTIVLDQMVSKYIKENPEASIINIACGMDTRFYRVDNGKIRWYNVDLPVTMELRAEYIHENRRVMNITASAMEEGWTSYIHETGRPFLIIAEGFSMYLNAEDIREILSIINHHFSSVTVFMEIMNPLLIRIRNVKTYTWGARNGKVLTELCPAFHWVEDRSVEEGMEEISPVYKVIGKAGLLKGLSNKIAVIKK